MKYLLKLESKHYSIHWLREYPYQTFYYDITFNNNLPYPLENHKTMNIRHLVIYVQPSIIIWYISAKVNSCPVKDNEQEKTSNIFHPDAW